MNWLDLVLILLVALAAAAGVWTGVIRAAFGTLGVLLGVLIAGQASDDLGGLYASYIASATLANVIAYGLIILVSLIVARLLTILVCNILEALFMGWIDRLAGLAIGLVAGAAISWAVIAGLAEMTYDSDLIDRGMTAGGLEERANVLEVKESLERGLMDSALVGVFLGIADYLPADALGFVPSNLKAALETLELRTESRKETNQEGQKEG